MLLGRLLVGMVIRWQGELDAGDFQKERCAGIEYSIGEWAAMHVQIEWPPLPPNSATSSRHARKCRFRSGRPPYNEVNWPEARLAGTRYHDTTVEEGSSSVRQHRPSGGCAVHMYGSP